jgi:aminoglycoside phosphotransferase (APT) family kinase protein
VTSDAPAELLARIREAFPALAFETAVLNDYGDDNRVVVLDSRWIVRIPRNDEYRARFAAELNLLSTLRGLTRAAVPHYEFVSPDGGMGAYRMIAGTEMRPPVFHALHPLAQRAILKEMGEFLTVLHGLPASTIAQPDGFIPQTWSGAQFAALYRGMRRAKIARAVDARSLVRFDAFHDAFETIEPGPSRLAHDDISDDHILVTPAGLGGIIDFSDVSFGDVAIDFGWFWRLGEAALDRVLADYGPASRDGGLKMRSHWTFVRYLINQLSYGDRAKWHLPADAALAELDPHLKQLGF